MANKIKYGLKNVYYAVATIGSDNTATYDTPVAIPGAVNLSLEPQGELSPFYADNIEYFVVNSNNGYEGDLEVALIPDSFKKSVLGMVEGGNGILYEDVNAPVQHFALLFQFEGDQSARRHVMYNCTAQRPSVAGQTKGENIEPQTETMSITARSIYVAALETDIVKGSTDDTTGTTVYNGWFDAVTIPTAGGATT